MARSHFIVADKYGIDPLLNRLDESLDRIPVLTTHTVTQDEIGHAQLISNKYYQTFEYDFAILKFNGLLNEFELKEGMTLQIPNIEFLKQEKKPVQQRKSFKQEVKI